MTRRSRNTNLLARVNFPLYSMQLLTSRHVLVAGGGGSSNTGVKNGFEVFELLFDGKQFVFKEVLRYETGSSVVMNCAVYSNLTKTFLVAGQESHCQLYNVRCNVKKQVDIIQSEPFDEDANENTSSFVRNRKNETKHPTTRNFNKAENINCEKNLEFIIQPSDSIQTDFNAEESFQRVVRISLKGNLIATGGTDGHIRIWKFPSFKQICDISAHQKEIDDLDFNTDESQIVSISKDGAAILWNTRTGEKIRNLDWRPPNGTKYLYKKCRFAPLEQELTRNYVVILNNPVGKSTNKPSYIQLWNPNKGSVIKQVSHKESLSALSVRNDGRFLAVGTMFTGSVIVYIAFNLQKVLQVPHAHSMFITGLEFLPVSNNLQNSITTGSEFAVLSISVDNKICIHSLPYTYGMPLWVAIFLFISTLVGTFFLCDYIGL